MKIESLTDLMLVVASFLLGIRLAEWVCTVMEGL